MIYLIFLIYQYYCLDPGGPDWFIGLFAEILIHS